ncbi:hypothetical protein MBLNU13_g09803t1 [Cladosporium sp. NU13]
MQYFLLSKGLRDRVKQDVQRETTNSEIKGDGSEELIIVFSNEIYSTNSRSWSPATATDPLEFRQARSKSYHVSPTTETALTAIFMVDLSASALFVEPLSETVGRNPIYLASTAVMIAFTLEAALAPIYGTQLAFRFLSGVASSPSLSIYGGTLADLFDYKARRAVWPVFSISPLLGPVLAPVAGGWMSISSVDWQLPFWIALIMVSTSFVLALLALPETFE